MHEDEILGKAYDHQLMKRLLRYLRPYRFQVALGVGTSLLISAMEAVRPWFIKQAADSAIPRNDHTGLILLGAGLFGLMLIRSAIQFGTAYLTQWIGQKAILDLRLQLFNHLQRRGIRYFDTNPIGRLVTRVTNDLEVLSEMFSSGIVMVFTDIFTITGILYFMFSMNWRLALISLSVLPFLFYATFLFRRKAREAYRDVRRQLARINTFTQEHVSGIAEDKLFNREEQSARTFREINAAHRDANIHSVFYYAVFFPSVELIGVLAVGLILWYAGLSSAGGGVTLGTVMAFLQFNEMFWRPVRDLSEKYNILQTAMASSERVFKVLDDQTVVPDPAAPVPLARCRGHLRFDRVWFAYQPEEWVLKDVSFEVSPGETVAIVGHTGAGKTSIINLLSRLYEFQRGDILLDGQSIRHIRKLDLRRQLSVVQQDVFLFSGPIAANITLGNPAISEARLQEAARLVGADRFIRQQTNGYHQDVKERGAGLSAGQRQLISFARALAYDPAILILDEATSSVDTETEQLIQSAIRLLLQDRTAIVVAHRLSTIQHAHRIIVLHKGEVREAGTHQELLTRGGIYHKLYQLQYRPHRTRVSPASS